MQRAGEKGARVPGGQVQWGVGTTQEAEAGVYRDLGGQAARGKSQAT